MTNEEQNQPLQQPLVSVSVSSVGGTKLNKMKNLSIEKKLELTTNALMQLIEPSGAYSPDRLEHAQNCLKNTSEIAKHTLIKIGVKDCKLCANTVCRESKMEKDCYEDLANFKPMKTKLL